MISKMTKYSFILLSGQTDGFLTKLQELGVMDITRSVKPVDEASSGILAEAEDVKKALNVLKKAVQTAEEEAKKSSKGSPKKSLKDAVHNESETVAADKPKELTVKEAVKEILSTSSAIEETTNALNAAGKELSARMPWGEFCSDDIKSVEAQGLKIRFYICSKKKFDPAWAELHALQIVSENESSVYFVTVAPAAEEYDFPIEAVTAPEGSANEETQVIKTLEDKLADEKAHLLSLNDYHDKLAKFYSERLGDLDLYLAESATEKAADNTLTVFVGFAPTSDDEEVCRKLDETGVFYLHEAATKEDNPPIKLHNNWFARNFEVLTGMYGMPVYDEFDPTPVLAPFFMLFFAMCMGDAGYGILLVLIGIFMKFKMQDSGIGKMYRLVTILGVMTFFVGMVSGVFFGVQPHKYLIPDGGNKILPTFIQCMFGAAVFENLPNAIQCIAKMWQWFQDGMISGFPTMMVLAVVIGVFHICLAMVIKTIGYTKRFGFKNTISTWGWTLLIVGGIIVTALGMTKLLPEEVFKWTIIGIAVLSGLAIYIFNTPGRNPLKNIGAGLWDTYNMATGLLGDTLSYIRLYALGLAGGMLGNAFNIMGTMILNIPVPVVNWIFCIVILIFGHLLNLAMSCLGAFVHPLRLTFVEYFKNSGYEGTGAKYNPLVKQK